MIVFPNCKINLGLHITSKRADGYHNIESVFVPLPWRDALEIIPVAGAAESAIFCTGIPATQDPEENISFKAYRLLKTDFPRQIRPLAIYLHKTIPLGAGLGGGSSDAACTLQLLNHEFRLGLTDQRLLEYAARLGSDCPFFIKNEPCFATGRGELLDPIALNLAPYKFLLIYPGIRVDTRDAFGSIVPAQPQKSIPAILKQPLETWKADLKNDFEHAVFKSWPEIKNIKDSLYARGALYASLSGSGSCVYGIFSKKAQLSFQFPSNYSSRELAG